MTVPAWRPISALESDLIRAIVTAVGIRRGEVLLKGLDGALVTSATPWILDVKVSSSASGLNLPDGPLPGRAFVPNSATYQGEIIVWITDGRVSGLEYAWISDESPTRWPQPSEMQIIPQTGDI